jgi:polysaccharide export outer membrane protein
VIRLACAGLILLGSFTVAAAAEIAEVHGTKPILVNGTPPANPLPDSTAGDWSKVAEYRIVPGDEMILNFGPSSESPTGFLERTLKVRPDGRISVFPIGDVVAAGRTPRELEAAIVDMLGTTYKEPRVTIEVTKIAGNLVHVLGRVTRPGSYPADPFVTVAQALTEAGGFTDDAARNSVVVFHRVGAREVSVAVLPLDRMMKHGSLAADMPLERFDIVYVPRNTIGNITVFTQQVFGSANLILNTGLVGWELFNLSKVYHFVP